MYKIKTYKLFETNQYDYDKLGNLLIKAAWNNGIDDVKKLIKKGADINYQNASGFSPLMRSINNENESKGLNIANYLIKLGADLNLKDVWGKNAVMIAISNGRLNILKLLIINGADLLATDIDGYDMLYRSKTSYLNIIDWLRSYDGQKLLLTKEPALYKLYIEAGYVIKPKILEEMPYLSTANDLNLI